MSLQERINEVQLRIDQACERTGRNSEDVHVVAVTKYVSIEATKQVLDHGLHHIGENRLQVVKPKWEALGDRGVWHFIGHLQTNKVKDIIGKFTYIHSLDRISLAQELDKKAAQGNSVIQAFVQVNISGEQTKMGMSPDQVAGFLSEIKDLKHIHVIGLMTMAPFEGDPEDTRPIFRGLRELRDELNTMAVTEQPLEHLSMGMSNDFEVAVEEGATWLRLGTLLVGKEEEEGWES
ncbi:pyridoxal phosphate enzyme (YggS family) [Paenibacillus shirakamiensis]|uniref:Pyridoxal phosphate homeostasis protein n=1 Tax=Paenibacillus shirakamiensis TaxID=1265935 RepID=A0ABS4JBY8_9BACL|nr:YggS family pyridoxal phosphate-dependent enzyme [Paenibacillus shirakamiensis]MBP1999235.1 pyridoxal phosphate enzyme (YggS family) [Paenibacillus shirakamiensis]